MIRRSDEIQDCRIENFKGGNGSIISHPFIASPDELWGKGRVFSFMTLEENCEIGWHVHEGDGEIFCILEGEGEFNDNGTLTTLRSGDVAYTSLGEGHAFKNLHAEPLRFIALVLYT